ncbi:MAG: MATE family efflux transporter [Burkholderiaceae bacterium]|nr:MATE family efflux transporter [Burkholderiaceae bacterium]
MLTFTLAAKLVGAAKEVSIAWRYGRGPEVDAYDLALTLSTWLAVALVSVMTVVIVPALVQSKEQERKILLGDLNGIGLLFGLALGTVVWLAAPWLISGFAGGLPPSTQGMATRMLRQLSPLAVLTVFIGIYTTRLQSSQNHQYALAEGMPALAIVVLLLAWQTSDVAPLVAGTLLGTGLQLLWLARIALRTEGGRVGLHFRPQSTHWPPLWKAGLAVGVGTLTMSFVTPIDQYFAAGIGPGAIATLGYANRVVALAMTLGAATISRATLPVFSRAIAEGQHARVRRYAMQWAALVFFAGALGAAFIAILAPALVSLLFERGAFGAADTAAVASALRWGVWQLPFYSAALVFVSLLASMRRFRIIGAISIAVLLCKGAANLVLVDRLQLPGILAASVVMYAFSAVLFGAAARRSGSQG